MLTANQRLKQARINKGLDTQREAAAWLGVNEATYNQHENDTRGKGKIPRDAAAHYAQRLGVSLDWLITGKGEGPQPSIEPTAEDIEQMIREIIEAELKLDTKIADLPRIFGPALHEQLGRFRVDRAPPGKPSSKTSPDKGAQSPSATKPV
ncbi:helix-turn-helix domain-containing protein [Sphingomonas sp. PP-CE-3G-477]|uniref:helix-turn-helix domain-containing protein n=1 Tax=Sphingomonas sp. PP-CE-3G-477 TaxID=2135660 RepID=UPI0015E63D7B|nr:helix-turn-helix domain-containing protein [Sphingomonas sp. PP-CE-3G-477]